MSQGNSYCKKILKSRLSLSVNDLTTHFKETVSEKLTQDGELIHHVLYSIVRYAKQLIYIYIFSANGNFFWIPTVQTLKIMLAL